MSSCGGIGIPSSTSAEVQEVPRKVRVLGEDLVLFRDRKRPRRPSVSALYASRYVAVLRGASRRMGFVAAITAGCSTWKVAVSTSLASRMVAVIAIAHGSRGIRWKSGTGSCSRIWVRRRRSRCCPATTISRTWGRTRCCGHTLAVFFATGDLSLPVVPYSWLQMNDNVMDPFHVHVLHSTFSGIQFHQKFALMPKVDFFAIDHGVCYSAVRQLDDGREVDRISSWLMPNVLSVPDIQFASGASSNVAWVVPVDDSHYVSAAVMKLPKGSESPGIRINGKTWGEMTEAERQRFPGDYEAQAGQGAISLHSEEHLVTSDRGVMMQRRILRSRSKWWRVVGIRWG